MKYHVGRTLEPIRGRDDRIAGSGLAQIYRRVCCPEGGWTHEPDGEPVKILNLSTMPIGDGVTIQVAEEDGFYFVVEVLLD